MLPSNDIGSSDSESALLKAAEIGDVSRVVALLDHGAPIDSRRPQDGKTPLHLAAKHGHLETLHALLDRGASVHAQDRDGAFPLHAAVGDVGTLQVLLERGIDVDAPDVRLWTPLHHAAWKGTAGAIHVLADHGATIDAKAKNDWTPLHQATWKGRIETSVALLDRGARIDVKTREGRTPLHQALLDENNRMVLMFVACMAIASPSNDIDASSQSNEPVWRRLFRGFQASALQLLPGFGTPDPERELSNLSVWTQEILNLDPLSAAARLGHLDVLNRVVQSPRFQGFSPNKQRKCLQDAIGHASLHGEVKAAAYLQALQARRAVEDLTARGPLLQPLP